MEGEGKLMSEGLTREGWFEGLECGNPVEKGQVQGGG